MSALRVRPTDQPLARVGDDPTVQSPTLGTIATYPLEELVGASPLIQAVFRRIALAAPTRASVLVVGEPGTETGAVARAIHMHSARSHGPFVVFRAADRAPDGVEAALFGDADGAEDGLIAGADGGTLFVDEVATLPPAAQAKLLGVLDRQEFVPAGGHVPRPANVRVVAVQMGFAGDALGSFLSANLLTALGTYPIYLPPLRDRIEDAPLIAEDVLRWRGVERPADRLPLETRAFLTRRPWPGNVCELRTAVEIALDRAAGGPLQPAHFPTPDTNTAATQLRALVTGWTRERTAGRAGEPAGLHRELLAVVEPALLGEVLRQLDGRKSVAARWLGLSRATARKQIRAHLPASSDGGLIPGAGR